MGRRAHLLESLAMKALQTLALLGPLALAACQSAGTDDTVDGLTTDDLVLGGNGSEDTGKVVGVEELPPRFQEILDAWKAGGFVWEIKRSEVLSDPEETRFLVDNLVLAMFDEARSMQRAQSEFIPAKKFEQSLARIKGELAACGPVAAQAMAEILAVGDDFASAMARDVLSNLSADAAPAVVQLLDRDKAVVRYRALEALSGLPNAREGEAAVLARLADVAHNDRAEVVRAQACTTMGERGLFSQSGRTMAQVDFKPWARAIEGALTDKSEEVRKAALGALSYLGERTSVPAVVAAGERGSDLERTAARKALESITGKRYGLDWVAWKQWWAAEAARTAKTD